MALDLDKLKEKYEKINSKGDGNGNQKMFWKPKLESETIIRVVSTQEGELTKDYHQHYNLGIPFLCPKKNEGKECEVCNYAWELFNRGEPDDIKEAKKLFANQRFYTLVLVRGEEEKGLRWWSHSKKVFEDMFDICMDSDYGDITDLKNGFDLKVKYYKKPNELFPSTDVKARPKSSTFSEGMSEEQAKEVLENIPDLSSVLNKKTSEEVKQLLADFLSDEESENKEELDSKADELLNDELDPVDKAFDEMGV